MIEKININCCFVEPLAIFWKSVTIVACFGYWLNQLIVLISWIFENENDRTTRTVAFSIAYYHKWIKFPLDKSTMKSSIKFPQLHAY